MPGMSLRSSRVERTRILCSLAVLFHGYLAAVKLISFQAFAFQDKGLEGVKGTRGPDKREWVFLFGPPHAKKPVPAGNNSPGLSLPQKRWDRKAYNISSSLAMPSSKLCFQTMPCLLQMMNSMLPPPISSIMELSSPEGNGLPDSLVYEFGLSVAGYDSAYGIRNGA